VRPATGGSGRAGATGPSRSGRAGEAALSVARPGALRLAPEALSQLMPLHLVLDAGGFIRGAGPTLRRLCAGRELDGARLEEVFRLHRACSESDDGQLPPEGGRLRLHLRAPSGTALRGLAVPLVDAAGRPDGHLLNLSFGIDVRAAVHRHALTERDFAPTDLAVELLFLDEARSAVMQELSRLNARLAQARAEAERQALTDALTGLANRRAMDIALDTRTHGGVPFGLLHVDLDLFKQVNDTLGHAAGDRVLAEAARRLRDETRAGDVVARVGGDEFVVLLAGVTASGALDAAACRMIARLEAPIDVDGHVCRISASIGFTSSTLYSRPRPDRLLSDADDALYRSKRGGRGRATGFAGTGSFDPPPAADTV